MRSRMLAVVAALLVAGCVGGSDAPTTTLETGELGEEAADPLTSAADATRADVPAWSVGDAWTGASRNGDQSTPFTLVVTAADGDAYTVETTDEQTAGFDAMFDISYIGKIRKSDLAGSQQGTPVQFYSFPLEDGKTWTTTWDGLEVALTATKTAQGFDIVGTVDGEPYVELDYAHALRWWSRLDFVQDGYGITIDRVESGWTGVVQAATASVVYEGHPSAPVGSPGASPFTIDEGQTFGVVSVIGGGSQWARAFYLLQPDGTPYMTSSIENFEAEGGGPRGVFLSETIPPTPGTWHIAAPSVHDPAGAFHVTVHQVAVTPKQLS